MDNITIGDEVSWTVVSQRNQGDQEENRGIVIGLIPAGTRIAPDNTVNRPDWSGVTFTVISDNPCGELRYVIAHKHKMWITALGQSQVKDGGLKKVST